MEEQGNTSVLKIFIGNEYKIRVETPDEFGNSFFSSIYKRATDAVVEIKRDSDRLRPKESKSKGKDDEFNNLIAFIGERGSGKSSAMVSFTEFLESINGESKQAPEELQGLTFHALDRIDPTLFADADSIIRNIIANMFAAFKEKIANAKADAFTFEQKNEVIQKFQDVYESLKMLSMDEKKLFEHHKHSESSLDTLDGLAMGSKLRKRILELIAQYLHFMEGTHGKTGERKNYLVIPIDDLDMNMKHSAQVLEDIRRHLMAPNIVVLMAMKLDQLRDAVEQEYLKDLKVLRDARKQSYATTEEMANRYLEKVVPMERRLFLPVVKVANPSENEKTNLYFGEAPEPSEEDFNQLAPIEDTVLGMIYEATGIMFFVTEEEHRLIVPETLRELQNFLVFLHRLQEKPIANRLTNLKDFKSYFLHVWAKNVLEKPQERFLFDIDRTPNRRKNKFIVQNYLKNYSNNDPSGKKDEKVITNEILRKAYRDSIVKDFDEIIEPQNAPDNVSLGDLLAYLGMIAEQEDNSQVRKLNFAIKTLLTIEMQIALEADNGEIVQSIINGRIYHPNWHEFIPANAGQSRTSFPINGLKGRYFPKASESSEKTDFSAYTTALRSELKSAKADERYIKIDHFKQYEFINSFLIPNKASLETNFRNPKRNSNTPNPYWAGSLNVDFAYFDFLAWVHFVANPTASMARYYPNEGENTVDSNWWKYVSENSLFPQKTYGNYAKPVCPFPKIYNVGIFEALLNELKATFRQLQRTAGKTNLKHISLFRLVEIIFTRVFATIRKARNRNLFLSRPTPQTEFFGLTIRHEPFFAIVFAEKGLDNEIEKVLNDLPSPEAPIKSAARETISDLKRILHSLEYHEKNAHKKYKHEKMEEEIINALVSLGDEKNVDVASILNRSFQLAKEVETVRKTSGARMYKALSQKREKLLKETISLLKKHIDGNDKRLLLLS